MTNLKVFALFALVLLSSSLSAQKWFSRNGSVYFDATSSTSPEKIEGKSNAGAIVLDQASGALEMSVLVKSFLFEKSLMQEHFNENYLESSKFNKAIFKGKIDNNGDINYSKDGTYTAKISGNITVHGVTKPISTTATFVIKGGEIKTTSNFAITLSDFGIAIPSLVADKIAKQAKLNVQATLAPYKK